MDILTSYIAWAIALVCLIIVEIVYRRRYSTRGKKPIPMYPTVPIVGNGWYLATIKNLEQMHQSMYYYLSGGPIHAFWIVHKFVVAINDPKYIEALISKPSLSRKAEFVYNIFDHYTNGVFATRDVNLWAKLRKPLNNIMRASDANRWSETFAKNLDTLTNKIEKQQGSFDMENLTIEFTLANFLETHMGVSDRSAIEGIEDFSHASKKLLGETMFRLSSLIGRLDFVYLNTPKWKAFQPDYQKVFTPLKHIVRKRQNELRLMDEGILNEDPHTYTDVALKMAKDEKLCEGDTIRLILDTFVAGSDTVSSILASAILFIAMHREVQDKMYDEQVEIFGDSLRHPTVEEVNNMKYTEMVILETLRIAGTPGIGREADKDIDIDGYRIPKNSIVLFLFMNLHRDVKIWEKPLEFYPDHFLPEAVANRPKGAFFPFSAGARSCPGKNYAMLTMKMGLSSLVRKFKFSTSMKFSEVSWRIGITQVPELTTVTAQLRNS